MQCYKFHINQLSFNEIKHKIILSYIPQLFYIHHVTNLPFPKSFISSFRSRMHLVWFPFNLISFIYISNSAAFLELILSFCSCKNLTIFVEELLARHKVWPQNYYFLF